jgi:hypothetical protein
MGRSAGESEDDAEEGLKWISWGGVSGNVYEGEVGKGRK